MWLVANQLLKATSIHKVSWCLQTSQLYNKALSTAESPGSLKAADLTKFTTTCLYKCPTSNSWATIKTAKYLWKAEIWTRTEVQTQPITHPLCPIAQWRDRSISMESTLPKSRNIYRQPKHQRKTVNTTWVRAQMALLWTLESSPTSTAWSRSRHMTMP